MDDVALPDTLRERGGEARIGNRRVVPRGFHLDGDHLARGEIPVGEEEIDLDVNPSDLLNGPNSLGFFFEDMALRDLFVYSSALGGKLKHYRDSAGREVDAILELENGDYAAIEIKLGSEEGISSGVRSLLGFSSLLEKAGQRKPKFSMVLTSHGQCSLSEEGVYIVSINHLRD